MPIEREHQNHRRTTILQLLKDHPMKRQIEIGRALRKMGFRVTQSTVSRDLEALGVVRRGGVYQPPPAKGSETVIGKMEEFIRRAHSAGPYMVVIQTTPGTAKAVSVGLRTAQWPEIRGILAEDDTVFVATDNVFDTRLMLQRVKRTLQD